MREFDLLNHIYKWNTRLDPRVLIGPGDDMALVEMHGRRLLAAVDQLVDGQHVRVATTPIELVGRKAIARSLSDIAAMAGNPLATLVAATLPPDFGNERANALFDAMRETAERYRAPLIGGDLAFHFTPSHPLACSVTVLAEPSVPAADGPRAIPRSGAHVGDVVCVTGTLGGSLQPDGLGRHLTFEPRIDLAIQIGETLGDRLRAMIDISDGLGRDASHIAELSNVQIRLDADSIPCNPDCNWRRALSDGEDYELCFTAAPPVPDEIAGNRIYKVGNVTARGPQEPLVVVKHGVEFLSADDLGWQHKSEGGQ